MTNAEFKKTLNKVYREYQRSFMAYLGPSEKTKIKGGIIEQIKDASDFWKATQEIPQKIKFNDSIKRKYIVSVFSELGLKVTRYTREYGKTIVHFEPISDSK